ncbi:hypothetical protein RBA63_19910 [Brenneria goodwinii]|uniref:hypothetical protein n=1 Tax=Brenneria goodwinii TaxID=1109412 RepID=UPI0036F155A3
MVKIPANIIVDLLCALFFLVSLLIGSYNGDYILVPFVVIVYHVWKTWQLRNSVELAFLLIFSLTYPLFWIISIFLAADIHYLFSNVNNYYVSMAFSAQGLFMCCLFIGMMNKTPATIASHPCRNSATVFWVCIFSMLVLLVIAVSSIDGSIFEQSYDYEGESSILFEYVLILIIIAYAYSGQVRFRKNSLIIASLLFVLAPLYFGKRLPASMIAFALLLLFWRPKNIKRVMIIFFAGFLFLSLLAVFRVGESSQSIVQILLNIGDEGAMRNNQGGVVYSSAAYMKLTEIGAFDIYFGLESMANVALSIFLPSSMVDQSAYINFSAMKYIPIPGNGGFPGVAFYVWGRWIGIIVMGLFFGWIMRRSHYNYMSSVYVSFMFFTFPRWMAYNVNIMFKAGVLLMIGWLLVRIVIRSSRKDEYF